MARHQMCSSLYLFRQSISIYLIVPRDVKNQFKPPPLVPAAVYSKAMVLLLFNHCLLLLSLFVCFCVQSLFFAVLFCPFWFCNHLAWKERAGCFFSFLVVIWL